MTLLIFVNKYISSDNISNKVLIFILVKIRYSMKDENKKYETIINESGTEASRHYYSANSKRITNKPTKAKFNNAIDRNNRFNKLLKD